MEDSPLTLKKLKLLLRTRGFGVYIYKTAFCRRAIYYLTTPNSTTKTYRRVTNIREHLKRWICFDDFQTLYHDRLMLLGKNERIARLVVLPPIKDKRNR